MRVEQSWNMMQMPKPSISPLVQLKNGLIHEKLKTKNLERNDNTISTH